MSQNIEEWQWRHLVTKRFILVGNNLSLERNLLSNFCKFKLLPLDFMRSQTFEVRALEIETSGDIRWGKSANLAENNFSLVRNLLPNFWEFKLIPLDFIRSQTFEVAASENVSNGDIRWAKSANLAGNKSLPREESMVNFHEGYHYPMNFIPRQTFEVGTPNIE